MAQTVQKNSFLKNYGFLICMIIGIVAGCIVGAVWPGATALEPIGTIFINMMFCVVVPMVFVSISSAIANMKSARRAGKVMGTTVVTFLCTAAIAAVIMYILVRVINIVPAGFEAIEIHCAHGYLIQNFLSPYSNKRTDQWGGSFENRSRFAREVMRNVRKKVGPDYPLLTRVSWSEPTVEGGLELEEQIRFCQMLEAEGSDLIDVSVGVYGYQHYLIPPIDMPLGLNVEAAAEIKKHVNIPVSVVG